MTQSQKILNYLTQKQLDKFRIVIMPQAKWNELLPTIKPRSVTQLKKKLLNTYQIELLWEYSNNYITFRKARRQEPC